MRKKLLNVFYTLLGAVLLAAIWWAVCAARGDRLLFPTPADALLSLRACLAAGWFWRGFFGSLFRALIAFCAALALAVLLVFWGKLCPSVRRVLAPVVGTVRSIPTMSVILILVLWTGEDATPPIVAGLVVFPVLYSGLWAAVAAVPRELDETALLYAPSKTYRFVRVTLPLLLPSFSVTAGGASGLVLKLTVAAEVLAQTQRSLGLLMQQSQTVFDMGRLMALTLAVIAASLLFEGLAFLVRRAVGTSD